MASSESHRPTVNETEDWHNIYHEEAEQRYRLDAMPGKFKVLGLHKIDRNAKILDMCCGAGEALMALHSMGFHDLSGVDLSIPTKAKLDPRFKLVEGDATDTKLPAASYDVILNLHSLHHFATPAGVDSFLAECDRLLKPGGRLAIVDFPNSPQNRFVFWLFRKNIGLVTPHLKFLGKIIREEWHFLGDYLRQWPQVRNLLHRGRFAIELNRNTQFFFYLLLRKP